MSAVCLADSLQDAGRAIGKVTTKGDDLIVLELADQVLGKTNLFDLPGRTLRFTRDGSGYRVETRPLHWDSSYGAEFTGFEVSLKTFTFPFSGKQWKSFMVGASGSIRFGVSEEDIGPDPYGHRDAGIVLDRFDELAAMADKLGDKAPAICVFLKPRMLGRRYVKSLPDRVVITWDLTEPFGGLLDFTWLKTANRFQAVLKRDGSIEMSYQELTARDAIVGIYPAASTASQPVAVHFSALSRQDGPFSGIYEAFHYLALPRPQDLSCTVIRALGDNFDFLVYYSDFRVDNQEASTPGHGPIGGDIRGIGNTRQEQTPRTLENHCTRGRFQQGFDHPVYVGSNETQPEPPQEAPSASSHDLGSYAGQLVEASPDGKPLRYNYAVGHLAHEIGHRWSAYVTAKINDKTVSLTDWPHWAPGLHSQVAFPYSLPVEASTLGGGAWQDNLDGTYTQLRDGFFVPAAGYSFLDLYLMGLISAREVPDFFMLTKLVREGSDRGGHSVFRAERTKITIQDVIAAEGPRLPDVDHSQRRFNTGIVVVVEHGKDPSSELIERAREIGQQWIEFWRTATGRRASMSVSPR
jgi:hypothetical protein